MTGVAWIAATLTLGNWVTRRIYARSAGRAEPRRRAHHLDPVPGGAGGEAPGLAPELLRLLEREAGVAEGGDGALEVGGDHGRVAQERHSRLGGMDEVDLVLAALQPGDVIG